jgi:glucokinase
MVRLDVHKNWREVPLGELIQKELNLPVFLVEEAHARLVGIVDRATEHAPDNLIYLLAGNIDGEGLSGAVMTNGAIVGGSSGFAGEMGHMQADPQGPLCPCGRRGCWETVGSLEYLAKRLGVPLLAGKEILRERLFQPACRKVLEDFISVHANGIVNLIHVFNPQTVIVGGELALLGGPFFMRLFERVRGEAMEPFRKNLELLVRQDEDDALRGASAVALKEVLTTFNIKGYAYA